MNPSASGWIDKFGHLVKEQQDVYQDFEHLYTGFKETGFVYGINLGIPGFITTEHTLSEDEKAKINLLAALYFTFRLERKDTDFGTFLDTIFQFYRDLAVNQMSFFHKIVTGSKTSSQLEKLINSRVYLEDNVISKTFNSSITNSLLFIDVLIFKHYLTHVGNIRAYAQTMEYLTINISYHALNSKEPNKTDEKLLQLLESSLTFIDSEKQNFDGSYREELIQHTALMENQYFLDVACLTVWEDKTLDYQESEFIYGIGKDLGFDEAQIEAALNEITLFFETNSNNIPFLKDTNMAWQFYNSMSKAVRKLILRNSKRLQKELSESKELVALLTQSTLRELSTEEKKKVQNQLLDIFKSIPSLAIFMLPGGAVLLPIFIKLIPKLLPSSF
ncbi:MAG: LETM1-related biofilm-associated protein, partial [Bacteroidota bacterium]